MKDWREYIILLIIFSSTAFLRFQYLGYSDYIPDEPGAFLFYGKTPESNETAVRFLLNQRKGPLQFVISHIPYSLTGTFNNELAERIPFAIFNILSVVIFYKFVSQLTGNRLAGFVSAMLLSTNGFTVAFGRIAQYQSLNLFFSISALYLYSRTLLAKDSPCEGVSLYLAPAALGLSFLAHWDAVLILPIIIYFFIVFLLNKRVEKKCKLRIILINGILIGIVVLSFLVPYLINLLKNTGNLAYLQSRIGLREAFDHKGNLFTFLLYNPFYTLQLYAVLAFSGMLFLKKTYPVIIWTLLVFAYYTFLVHHAGTHIYNLLIPLIVLAGAGVGYIAKLLPKYSKSLSAVAITVPLVFFYYQSYIIFVDHKIEYPWEREIIMGKKTSKYTHENLTNNKIGFPHKRHWKEINAWISTENRKNKENLNFLSNEDKALSTYYMSTERKQDDKYYLIGIKQPYSFQNDWKMAQISNKKTIHTIKDEYGTVVVKIYFVNNKTLQTTLMNNE